MREKDGRLERIADRVVQSAFSLQSRILRGAWCALRMHEEQHTKFLGLCPERIELPIRKFLTFDAATDRRTAQSEFFHGFFQLIGGEIRMLQGNRRHSYEP